MANITYVVQQPATSGQLSIGTAAKCYCEMHAISMYSTFLCSSGWICSAACICGATGIGSAKLEGGVVCSSGCMYAANCIEAPGMGTCCLYAMDSSTIHVCHCMLDCNGCEIIGGEPVWSSSEGCIYLGSSCTAYVCHCCTSSGYHAGCFYGTCCSGGVYGCSDVHCGVTGHSCLGYGVYGLTMETDCNYAAGMFESHSTGCSHGVKGFSCCGHGVYGIAQDSSCDYAGVYGEGCYAHGVKGVSECGAGVYGESCYAYGGYFYSCCCVPLSACSSAGCQIEAGNGVSACGYCGADCQVYYTYQGSDYYMCFCGGIFICQSS